MRRFAAAVLTAALFTAGAAPGARAQDPLARRAMLFDVGIYAGGGWSTDWYDVAGEDAYGPGVAPLFGLQASYWLSPTVGVRLHGAHMPAEPPDDGFPGSDWGVNNWVYDAAFVYRPWYGRAEVGQFRGSTYMVTGIGAITSNLAGPAESQTSVAVNIGIGATVARLSPRYALFGEIGTYLYQGPTDDLVAVNPKSALTVVGKFGLRRDWW